MFGGGTTNDHVTFSVLLDTIGVILDGRFYLILFR